MKFIAARLPVMLIVPAGGTRVTFRGTYSGLSGVPKLNEDRPQDYIEMLSKYEFTTLFPDMYEEQVDEVRAIKWFMDCGDDDYLLGGTLKLFRCVQEAFKSICACVMESITNIIGSKVYRLLSHSCRTLPKTEESGHQQLYVSKWLSPSSSKPEVAPYWVCEYMYRWYI